MDGLRDRATMDVEEDFALPFPLTVIAVIRPAIPVRLAAAGV